MHGLQEDVPMESMDNFRERFEALEQQMKVMGAHTRTVERRLRWWRGIACGLGFLGLVSLSLQLGTAADSQPGAMAGRMATLENKLSAMTFDGTANEVVISGANLRIVNGLGSTETSNGLGNLIVGYNELRRDAPDCPGPTDSPNSFCTDNRTGSHNVVVGNEQNFSSFGGLVAGKRNEISETFATVSGGIRNTASGFGASVSGGDHNIASGVVSSVSGGESNIASGPSAAVSGGARNTAVGGAAAVSGGFSNLAHGEGTAVSGGASNQALGSAAAVSGGTRNTVLGGAAAVSGGQNNTASGFCSSVSGGNNRSAPGTDNWAAGALFSDH